MNLRYYITPGRFKKGVQHGGGGIRKPNFPGSHAHIFHPVSTLIFINMYKRTTEKVSAQSVQIRESDFITPTRASPASAEPRWGLPRLAGKIRHPIYPPLTMTYRAHSIPYLCNIMNHDISRTQHTIFVLQANIMTRAVQWRCDGTVRQNTVWRWTP